LRQHLLIADALTGPTAHRPAISAGEVPAAVRYVEEIGGAGQNPSLFRFGFVDASRDGRELLFARGVADIATRSPVNVVINWVPDASR
jgi:hypothetical protein